MLEKKQQLWLNFAKRRGRLGRGAHRIVLWIRNRGSFNVLFCWGFFFCPKGIVTSPFLRCQNKFFCLKKKVCRELRTRDSPTAAFTLPFSMKSIFPHPPKLNCKKFLILANRLAGFHLRDVTGGCNVAQRRREHWAAPASDQALGRALSGASSLPSTCPGWRMPVWSCQHCKRC